MHAAFPYIVVIILLALALGAAVIRRRLLGGVLNAHPARKENPS